MKTFLKITLVVALVLTLSEASFSQPGRFDRRTPPPPVPETPGIWHKSLVGGQLGPWISDGFGEDVETETIRLKANSTAFHLEFFYMPHLTGPLNLDISLGAVSRGDIRITDNNGPTAVSGLGTATLYPLGIGLAWFPFAKSVSTNIQPSLRAGGSLIVGTESVDAVVYDAYGGYIGSGAESRFELGYYGGVNLLWVLGTQFGLTGGVKYQHAKFDKELFGVKDYSGVQILFGATYLYH